MLGFLTPIARRLATWLLAHGKEELEKAVVAELEKRNIPAATKAPAPLR